MTSDPERLLRSADSDDGAELERELFRSLADVSPPDGAREAAWRGISTHLAAASVAAAAATAAGYVRAGAQAVPGGASIAPQAGSSLLHALSTKIVLGAVVAAGAAGIGGTWLAGGTPADAPAKSGAVRAVPPPPESAAPESTTSVAGTPASEPTPTPASPPRAAPRRPEEPATRRAEAVALESTLVRRARSELQQGDPRAALATLQRLQREAPGGVLHQEREVIAVQALAASGQKAAARRRARAFVAAHPESPHAPLLRPLAGDP